MPPTRSHSYTFALYSVPTIDDLIAELQAAREIMGGAAKARLRSVDDQRDGYSLHATVTT